jgi:hypothetical protein
MLKPTVSVESHFGEVCEGLWTGKHRWFYLCHMCSRNLSPAFLMAILCLEKTNARKQLRLFFPDTIGYYLTTSGALCLRQRL